ICSVPYGYTMTDSKAMKFEVNEKQAEVVRMIYDMYLSGMGYKAISRKLTEMKIPTARQDEIVRRETMGKSTRLKSSNCWSIVSVSEILRNDFYIGTLRQHKFSRKKINGSSMPLPESEHIVIENFHTPIIPVNVFEQVQQQLEIRSRSNYRGIKKYRTDYTGYLLCGDCGKPMSSMSRPELAPAYRCSTYTKHGKSHCTSHHIRIDRLDGILKKYIVMLRDNSIMIAEKLDKLLAEQQKTNTSADTSETINRQITQLKSELTAAATQRIRDIMANPAQEELINETYDSIISAHSKKIDGLKAQLELISKREKAVSSTNKAVATTTTILNSILEKERLDRTDIGSIVESISVYDDHVEVKLLADIDDIINAESELASPQNRIGTSFDECVTVISEGDPLEIYTSADGEVIFKKYSAVNEMANSASQVAEVMTRLANCPTVVFDRDHVVAVAGVQKKEFSERRVSRALEEYLESRKNYIRSSSSDAKVFPVEGVDQAALACSPILASGDVTGAVAFLAPNDNAVANEVQQNLIQAAAQFLGKQIED
ncbi:MAG: stage V sporulation T C-terminal domain-containing protein, partial [Oscillospiraceae bacterium]